MKLRHALALAGALSLWSGSVLAADMQASLYKRLGGYDALAAVTDEFIGRLATDPQLAKFLPARSATPYPASFLCSTSFAPRPAAPATTSAA